MRPAIAQRGELWMTQTTNGGSHMAKRPKQTWEVGDVFLVETKDKMKVLGQIVGREPEVLNSVSCAFFDLRAKNEGELAGLSELTVNRVFSILFVTRDLLDNGTWRIIGKSPIGITQDQLPYENLRKNGYVGAKVTGSGNVV